MPDTKVSALSQATTPLAGTESLLIIQSSASRRITSQNLRAYIADRAFIRQASNYTLNNSTATQRIFGSTTNGRLTLTVGTYLIRALIHINTMSATSGNAQFNLLGAGTATLGSQLLHIVGVDGAAGTAATQTGSTIQGSNTSPASAVTAGTATAMTMNILGSFTCTAAGTIIPSVALVTAAAAVVVAGSWLEVERLGDTSLVSLSGSFGAWD